MITKDDSKNAIWLVYCDLRADYEQLSKERDQLKELLGIATDALGHYTYGGSNYAKVAVDALREIRQKAQENSDA